MKCTQCNNDFVTDDLTTRNKKTMCLNCADEYDQTCYDCGELHHGTMVLGMILPEPDNFVRRCPACAVKEIWKDCLFIAGNNSDPLVSILFDKIDALKDSLDEDKKSEKPK